MFVLATLLSVATAIVRVPASEDFRIGVYVTAPMRDGFVDTGKDIQDSVKDIQGKVRDTKELRLVEQASDADIVLTVVTRGVGSQAYGVRTNVYSGYYTWTDVSTVPIVANTFLISTVVQAGKYRKEFTGTQTQSSALSMGAWTEIAARISKEVKAWSLANAEQLRARRAKKVPEP